MAGDETPSRAREPLPVAVHVSEAWLSGAYAWRNHDDGMTLLQWRFRMRELWSDPALAGPPVGAGPHEELVLPLREDDFAALVEQFHAPSIRPGGGVRAHATHGTSWACAVSRDRDAGQARLWLLGRIVVGAGEAGGSRSFTAAVPIRYREGAPRSWHAYPLDITDDEILAEATDHLTKRLGRMWSPKSRRQYDPRIVDLDPRNPRMRAADPPQCWSYEDSVLRPAACDPLVMPPFDQVLGDPSCAHDESVWRDGGDGTLLLGCERCGTAVLAAADAGDDITSIRASVIAGAI